MAPTKSETLVVGASAIAVLASLAYLVHPWYAPLNDAAMYIATARALAAGEGYRFLEMPFVVRPPGFSMLIAPIVESSGARFFTLNLFVSIVGSIGVGLLYVLERERLGWILSLIVALAVWLNPGYQRLCTSIMSDIPGVASLLACLLLDRWCTRKPGTRRECILGLAVGLSAYLRMANLLLVPAIVGARLLRSRSGENPRIRGSALVTSAAALLILPWVAFGNLHSPDPPVDQTKIYSYATAMFRVDPGDPASPALTWSEIGARIPLRARQIAVVLGSRMQTRIMGTSDDPSARSATDSTGRERLHLALGLLLFLILATRMLRRPEAGEWFAVGTALLLLVYFGLQDRLLLPVFVVAVPAIVGSSRDLLERWVSPRAAGITLGVIVIAIASADFAPREGWSKISEDHRRLEASSSQLIRILAPDARFAVYKGFQYNVFMNRPVFSLHRAIRRARSPRATEEVIDRYDLDTVVLTNLRSHPANLEEYMRSQYGEPQRAGDALIWKVR